MQILAEKMSNNEKVSETYPIRANKRPAAYKKIRVIWWWPIAILAQKPQKGDFLPKKSGGLLEF